MGVWVQVQGVECEGWGVGCRGWGVGCGGQRLGCRVQGVGVRVQGAGLGLGCGGRGSVSGGGVRPVLGRRSGIWSRGRTRGQVKRKRVRSRGQIQGLEKSGACRKPFRRLHPLKELPVWSKISATKGAPDPICSSCDFMGPIACILTK